jgi:O-antigen ligase
MLAPMANPVSATSATARDAREPSQQAAVLSWRSELPNVAVVVAVAWWLLGVTRLGGGLRPGAVTVGALLTAAAVCAVRPDRVLPKPAVWLAVWISAGAILVAATAPTGWAGAPAAASYVCAAWTLLSVAAGVVADRRLVDYLVLLLVGGVILELAETAQLRLTGTSNEVPMVGTFYWFDSFAPYLIPGTSLGLALWLQRRGAVSGFGLLAFILGAVGLVYSTSRAAGACAVIAVAIVLLANVRSMRGLVRVVIGGALTTGMIFLLAGPPYLVHRGSPLAPAVARTANASLAGNGHTRVTFWREGWSLFKRYPISGGGYHSLQTLSVGRVPATWPTSPVAHNGYVQALSDGGLLLAVPFVGACVVLGWCVLANVVSAARRRDFTNELFLIPILLGALLMHSFVDFDWTYPADLALAAVLGGIVAGGRWADRRRVTSSRATACAVLMGVLLLAACSVIAWHGDTKASLRVHHGATMAVSR